MEVGTYLLRFCMAVQMIEVSESLTKEINKEQDKVMSGMKRG